MRKALFFMCAALLLAVSALTTQRAHAENQHYLTIKSKELLYNPADMTAASFMKNEVSGRNFRLVSDRLQVDFKNNTLRAGGNVYLYAGRSSDFTYPQFGEPEAIYDMEYFTGHEIVLNFEFREAVIYPYDESENPVTLDMNYARIVPALRHIGEAPAFSDLPEKNVFICFAISYYSNGRFSLSDATYTDENWRQYYSALLLADGPDLEKKLITSNQIYAKKSYVNDRNWQPQKEVEANSDTTVWLRNHPRYSTVLDLDGTYTEERGFRYFSPALLQTVSFGNFSATGRVENNETGLNSLVSVSTYTPSRNHFSLSVSHDASDYGDELTLAQQKGSSRDVTLSSVFWDDDFRTTAYWFDSRHADDFHYSDTGPYYDYDNRYRSFNLVVARDPFRVPFGNYHVDITGNISRGSSNSRDITAADTYNDYQNTTSLISLNPHLIAGPFKTFGNFHLAQTVSWYLRYQNKHSSRSSIAAGALTSAIDTSANDSYYKFDALTRLFMPIGNSFNFEIAHNYAQNNSTETSGFTPGLTHTWNARDYVFVGAAYDFSSRDWETMKADLVVRRAGDARLFYSYRYNLLTDDIEKNAAGLMFDFRGNTLAISYEDVESELRVAIFSDTFNLPAGKNLLDSIPE